MVSPPAIFRIVANIMDKTDGDNFEALFEIALIIPVMVFLYCLGFIWYPQLAKGMDFLLGFGALVVEVRFSYAVNAIRGKKGVGLLHWCFWVVVIMYGWFKFILIRPIIS